MPQLLLLFACLLSGILLRRYQVFPTNAAHVLNLFVFYISLPALTLRYIPFIEFKTETLLLTAVSWIVFGGAALFLGILYRLGMFSRSTFGAMLLVGGLGNTAFVGFPLVEALYGKEGLEKAIVLDLSGSFVVVSIMGIAVAAWFSSGSPNWSLIGQRIMRFPPFVVFLLCLLLNLLNVNFPPYVLDALERIGSTVSILSLVSVGLQLRFELASGDLRALITCLSYKLLLAPAFIYVLYVLWLGQSSLISKVSVIEAATPPMVTAAILASDYDLNPTLANLAVGVGIIAAIGTVLLWHTVLG